MEIKNKKKGVLNKNLYIWKGDWEKRKAKKKKKKGEKEESKIEGEGVGRPWGGFVLRLEDSWDRPADTFQFSEFPPTGVVRAPPPSTRVFLNV